MSRLNIDARQMFVLAVLFFVNVTVLGCLFLLVMGKIAP